MPYQLTDLTIEAILKDWHPQNYYPPYTDVQQWIDSIESLCDLYGIPNVQRLHCALRFIKEELSTELRNVLEEARERVGPVHWDQFKGFLVVFDQEFRERWEELPFYKKHPKRTAVVTGIVGGAVLTGITMAALSFVGSTSASFVAGSTAVSYQSIAHGCATRAVLLSFQSAGTTAVMQSVGTTAVMQSAGTTTTMLSIGTILTGATATGAGVLAATANARPKTSHSTKLLQNPVESISHDDKSNNDGNPPPHRATASKEYLFTPRAIPVIVKSWDVQTYNPPRTNCTAWLGDIHSFCEKYGIPVTQRASCAMHHMNTDYQAAALNADCCDMTWDEFTVWLHQHDHEGRGIANGIGFSPSPRTSLAGFRSPEKIAEVLAEKSRA